MSRNADPGRFVASIGAAIGLAFGFAIAPAANAQDYYAGKTINFIVGTDTSGGFNIYARLIAPHLRRHIPGNPAVIVRNMPGAGGATAAAHMFQQAPKDGTTIAALTPSAISARLLQGPAQNVADPTKFTYLAGAERGTRVCYTWHTSPTKTLADALARKTVIGTTASGSPTTDYAAAIKHTTGAQFHIASGYKGVNDLNLAMERGEVDGICGLDWSALKVQQGEWVKAGKLNILVQATIEPVPELVGDGRTVAVGLHQGSDRPPCVRADGRLPAGVRQSLPGTTRCRAGACRGVAPGVCRGACAIRSFWRRRQRPASRSCRPAARQSRKSSRTFTPRHRRWSSA